MTVVSTQTSLSCPGYDNLLPQTLLFNLVTAKVAEAFQLSNVHAQSAHYTDNLTLIKKEDVVFPHYRPRPSLRLEDAHLDLVYPSTHPECFSPDHYKAPKRQRLNSLPQLPVKTIERPPEKISFNKTLGLLKKDECLICVEGFENKTQLEDHLKICPKFLLHAKKNPPVSKPYVCETLNLEKSETVHPQLPCSEKTSYSSSENIDIKKGRLLRDKNIQNKCDEKESPNPSNSEKSCSNKNPPVSKPDFCESLNLETSETVHPQLPCSEKTSNSEKSCSSSTSSENIEIKKVKFPIVKNTQNKSNETEGSELNDTSDETKPTSIGNIEEIKLDHSVTSDDVNKWADEKTPPTSEGHMQNNKRRRIQSRKARENKCTEEALGVEDERPGRRRKVSVKVNVKKKKKISVPKTSAFQCSKCNCYFTSKWTMKRHEYTIHGIGTPLTSDDVGNRQFGTECHDCIDALGDSGSAQDVSMSHDIKEDLPSPSKLNTILQSLCAQTVSTNADSEWLCGVCGLRFKSRILLKRHGKSHRDKTEIPDVDQDGMFMCYVCFEKIPSFRRLLNHQAKHAYRPKCGICLKTFPLISMLNNHKCGKVDQSDVECAQLIQVKCRHCSLTFQSAIQAKRHMSTVHAKLQNVMSSTVCRLCDYTFSSSTKYLVHKSVSHPTPEFLCFICEKLYVDRKGLEQHCTKFHNTKPYICTVCEDGFDILSNLQRHKSALHFAAGKLM